MAEMLVAIFVVAVGILGTVAALWYGIQSERYSDRRTTAVFQGRELINAIRANNYAFNPLYMPATPASQRTDLNDGDYDDDNDDENIMRAFNEPPFANQFPNNPFNLQRHVEMKYLSSDNTNYLSKLAAIKVQVVWEEAGVKKHITLWTLQRQR